MKLATRFIAAVVVSGCAYLGTVVAADWPGFRGTRGGVSDDKDVPIEWTSDSFLWKLKLPGPGASSPITFGDKVFVTCYAGYGTELSKGMGGGKGGFGKGGFGKGGFGPGGKSDPADVAAQKNLRFVVLCIDAAKGEILWKAEIDPKLPETGFSGMIREHGYATSTPVTDGERLYAFFGKSGVVAFDIDGKELWRADVGSGVNTWGMAASPVLYKDLVIVNAAMESGALLGLDKRTGKEQWRTKGLSACWGSPIVAETKDGKQEVVLSLIGKIAGFDPETGKQLWHCAGFQGGSMPGYGGTYSTPVAQDGVVYVTGGGGPNGGSTAIAIKMGGQGDVNQTHVLWKAKAGGNFNSPVVRGDFLYCIDGTAVCLRTDSGKVVYKERLYESRGDYVSPVIAGDKVFMLTRFDGFFVLAAGSEFKQLAHNDFAGDKSVFNANPAIANGRIYVRSNQYLYCIGKK